MRTTLTLDDDVLTTARAMASRDGTSVGAVLSRLARAALQPVATTSTTRNGVPLLSRRPGSVPVTMELVNQLRDETE